MARMTSSVDKTIHMMKRLNEQYKKEKLETAQKSELFALALKLYDEYLKGKCLFYKNYTTIIILKEKKPEDLVCCCEVEPKKYWSDNLEIVLMYDMNDPYKLILDSGSYKMGELVKSFCYKDIGSAYKLVQAYLDDGITKMYEEHRCDDWSYTDQKLEGMFHKWYGTQLIQEEIYTNGVQVGFSRHWHETGRLALESFYADGKLHGFHRGWYKSGQMKYEVQYVNGVQNGFERNWYKSGQMKCEIHYVNDKRDGLTRYWYKSGQLSDEILYDNGKRISEKRWSKIGEVINKDDELCSEISDSDDM